MDTSQVFNLAEWMRNNLPGVKDAYSDLYQALQHNATQSRKQPVRGQIAALTALFEKMSFKQLTNEEIDVLGETGVLSYIGGQGADFLQEVLSDSSFDPASAAVDIQEAVAKLEKYIALAQEAQNTLREFGLEVLDKENEFAEFPLVRVRFKEDASIEDVSSLKKLSSEWYDITRGAALSVGETPHSVRVVGASNGSIIVTLGTIASVTMILAIIAKNAGRIASEVLSITNDIEDLRHKKRLNKVIEDELKRQQQSIQERGAEDTLSELQEALPEIKENSAQNELRKSIEKYFDFYKKGGDVDFLPPRSKPEEAERSTTGRHVLRQIDVHSEENAQLLSLIEDVRSQQAELLQLMHHPDDPDENNAEEGEE